MDAPREYSSDDITRLGTGLNDLGSILALPAVWSGAEPSQIVSTLVDTLLEILHLSFVFVRLSALDGTPSIEIMRIADSLAGTDRAREIRDAIDASLGDASPKPLSRSTTPVGEVDLSVASARLGLDGEIGIIVAGSHRADFPAQTERLFLDIAANQATIGLQHADLTEQRRAAQELDERVAQRTRELAIADEALRESEHNSRLLAAVTIATKLFWALDNQVESFLSTFDPKLATIDPKARVRRPSGARTPFTWDDLHAILEGTARNADGTYRIVAGRLIPGKILGNFRFEGTRPDDPNDIVPHEHRRELRGCGRVA
jgi:hypothetical protein